MGRGRSEYWNKALGVKNALWKKLGTSEDMATSLCVLTGRSRNAVCIE